MTRNKLWTVFLSVMILSNAFFFFILTDIVSEHPLLVISGAVAVNLFGYFSFPFRKELFSN